MLPDLPLRTDDMSPTSTSPITTPADFQRLTARLEQVLELRALQGMDALAKNGLRYPFASYGLQQDVRAGMAASYPTQSP